MAENSSGLYALLRTPFLYGRVQQIFGARSARRTFVERFIRPKKGEAALDIGCGTAELLAFMPGIEYVGYDPNPSYIEYARKRFGERGQFFWGYFGPDDVTRHGPFDIGILSAVLHHLDDIEATNLLSTLRTAIKPGGRLITVDNVFIDDQNPIARKLIEWDRGKNVRRPAEYRALIAPNFSVIHETIVHKRFPPYTLFITECR